MDEQLKVFIKRGQLMVGILIAALIVFLLGQLGFQSKQLELQNQNQITYDTNFNEVTKIRIVDMDIDVTQQALKEIYNNLRQKLIEGNRSKSIYSDCKRGLLDGYGHNNSYRFRLTDKFMKKIQNIAGSRDTFTNLFEVIK